MPRTLLLIRLKQFLRASSELGPIRIIVLLVIATFLGVALFAQTSQMPNALFAVLVYSGLITTLQVKRPDRLFLRINFSGYRLILFTEYLVLSSPLLVLLAYHRQWLPLAVSLAILYPTTYVDFKLRKLSLNSALQRLIPSDCFEWKGGVRRMLAVMVPLWILALATSFFVGSVPIAIFILGILPLSFYEMGEPVQMLLAPELNANRYLYRKVRVNILIFTTITLPLIIAFIVFHPNLWYIPIAEYFFFITIHIYAIFIKYSFYQPNCKSSAAQIFGTIGLLGVFFPFIVPAIWLLTIYFYIRSVNNLKIFLNDYP